MRYGTKIHFSMYKREKKGRDEEGSLPYKLPWNGESKKNKKPKLFGVKNTPKQQSNLRIKKQALFRSNIHDFYQNFKDCSTLK